MLALEIAVDSLAVAVVGLGGQVLELARVERPRGHVTPDDIVADLVELAAGVGDHWRHEALVGIGVAVVGVVRRDDGFVSTAPNLGWRDVALGAALTQAFGAPVAVANEADLGALAEHRRGAAARTNDVIFLSGEVGVGGGIIVGGRPLTGVAGHGGEVGHTPVNPLSGRPCRCGSVGCWETEVGEEALLVRAGRPPDGGSAAVEAVLADAAAGDDIALAAVGEIGRWLGIGLAGLVNVLNPSRVVLGGRFARLHPFIATTVEEVLDSRALAGLAGVRRGRPGEPRRRRPTARRGGARARADPRPIRRAGSRTAPASRRPVHMVTDEEGVQLTWAGFSGSARVRHTQRGRRPACMLVDRQRSS